MVALIACSHFAAIRLAIGDQTLNTNNNLCQPIGYVCDSYANFNYGKCGDCGANNTNCKPMELSLNYYDNQNNWYNNTGDDLLFYLNTGVAQNYLTNYCLFHYQIVVNNCYSLIYKYII